MDSFTREGPALEVESCLSSRFVTRVLDRVIEQPGAQDAIRCDKRSRVHERHLLAWGEEHKIRIIHIQPGRPMQNGCVESFNRRFRDECLNTNWSVTMADARQEIDAWRQDYNDVVLLLFA